MTETKGAFWDIHISVFWIRAAGTGTAALPPDTAAPHEQYAFMRRTEKPEQTADLGPVYGFFQRGADEAYVVVGKSRVMSSPYSFSVTGSGAALGSLK